MKWEVEIGICWDHGTWTTMTFTVDSESEEQADKTAHSEALRWIEGFAPNGWEAVHIFTYHVNQLEAFICNQNDCYKPVMCDDSDFCEDHQG